MGVVKLSTAGILNYQKYDDFLAGNAAFQPGGNAYELLETTILGGDQASVTFSNLNSTYGSTYQHLQIRATMRTTFAATSTNIFVHFNGDNAGTSYAVHWLRGQSGTVVSAAQTSQTEMRLQNAAPAASATANIFAPLIMDILDPFETTKNKTVRALFGNPNIETIYLMSGFRNNTEAITSITIDPDGSREFVSGSRFSLYGLRSA